MSREQLQEKITALEERLSKVEKFFPVVSKPSRRKKSNAEKFYLKSLHKTKTK